MVLWRQKICCVTMQIKNNRIIIGTLDINSLSIKCEQLKLIIANYLDILVSGETKLDISFPDVQFFIDGYRNCRIGRIRNGGGVFIHVRGDIPSKSLTKLNFTKNIEGLFIEINLKKTKLLLFGTYHLTHALYGLTNEDYFKEVGQALDVYSNYEKFLTAGNFNAEKEEVWITQIVLIFFLQTVSKVFKTLLQYLLVYLIFIKW